MTLQIDAQFANHFRNLKQVFLYITDACNLECAQCIYKPSITYYLDQEIPFDLVGRLLASFFALGARKLTLLGGEPSIYGRSGQNPGIGSVIEVARRVGYPYIRMDSNGQFSREKLQEAGFELLDELAFSLDGHTSKLNDALRGKNTFNGCVARIRDHVALGRRASITCCVQRRLLDREADGLLGIEHMILFAQSLGVETINFHDLFKAGVPMDTWTGDFAPTVEAWDAAYHEVKPKIDAGRFQVRVRLPLCFVKKSEFARNPEYYGYCPVKLGERVMVHTHGVIRICSNLICTAYGVARYTDQRIEWDRSSANETKRHDLTKDTPCTNRSMHRTYGDFVPVCFSFKPDQDEPVWSTMLRWEDHRRGAQ